MNVDLSKLSLADRRQFIFDRCAAKYRQAGTPIDENEPFMILIRQWIAGGLEMREVLKLYSEIPFGGPDDRSGSTSIDLDELPLGRDQGPLSIVGSAKTTALSSEAPISELATMSQADLLLEIDRLIVENMPVEERQ